MKKYFVGMSGGMNDVEFEELSKISVVDSRSGGRRSVRVPQPDGSYREEGTNFMFDRREQAEVIAAKLREDTNDNRWGVFDFEVEAIEALIEEHRQFQDEPLLLAMHYDAGADPREIYVLEVMDNFGLNNVNPDRELFELTYWSPNRHEPDAGRSWHLVLTNPKEFAVALREGWDQAKKIQRAVDAGRYEIPFMTDDLGVLSRDSIHA